MKKPSNTRRAVLSLTLTAFFVALDAVCAYLIVPLPFVSFTMQTFAVFLSVYVLGTWLAVTSVAVYILLGALGLPVFAGFRGGIGVLLGPTGGYIAGFLFTALVTGLLISKTGYRTVPVFLSMLAGLGVCYLFGTVWFVAVYTSSHGPVSVSFVLGAAVLPFIIPDVIKIILAVETGKRLKPVADKLGGGDKWKTR